MNKNGSRSLVIAILFLFFAIFLWWHSTPQQATLEEEASSNRRKDVLQYEQETGEKQPKSVQYLVTHYDQDATWITNLDATDSSNHILRLHGVENIYTLTSGFLLPEIDGEKAALLDQDGRLIKSITFSKPATHHVAEFRDKIYVLSQPHSLKSSIGVYDASFHLLKESQEFPGMPSKFFIHDDTIYLLTTGVGLITDTKDQVRLSAIKVDTLQEIGSTIVPDMMAAVELRVFEDRLAVYGCDEEGTLLISLHDLSLKESNRYRLDEGNGWVSKVIQDDSLQYVVVGSSILLLDESFQIKAAFTKNDLIIKDAKLTPYGLCILGTMMQGGEDYFAVLDPKTLHLIGPDSLLQPRILQLGFRQGAMMPSRFWSIE